MRLPLRTMARLGPIVLAAALLGAPAPARAADGDDHTHGRIEGDVALAFGAGVAVGPRAPRLAADLRLRYLSTVGIYGGYEDGRSFGLASDPGRVVATGLELRPLFLARWLRGLHGQAPSGPLDGRLDLFLDSLAFELGVAFTEPARSGTFRGVPGLETGLGLELPLFPSATGLFVGFHGKVRWSDRALSGLPLDGPADRALVLGLTLGWQQVFRGRLVDVGDGRR